MNSKIAFYSTGAVSFLLWIGVLATVAATGQEPTDATINKKIEERILNFGLTGSIPIFVRMEDQLFPRGGDYERYCKEQPEEVNRLELRGRVIKTLKGKAGRSQNALKKTIASLQQEGHLVDIKHYWIVNGFACTASVYACRELAKLDEVNFIYRQKNRPQHQQPVPKRPDGPQRERELAKDFRDLFNRQRENTEQPFTTQDVEIPWNLKKIRADKAWDRHGVTGKGVVIALIDDGMMTVPALLPALWSNVKEIPNGVDDDGNGYVDDVFGYDFIQQSHFTVVRSGARHGTLCAGIVAARTVGDKKRIATGVAPRAKIMPLIGPGFLSAYEYAVEQGSRRCVDELYVPASVDGELSRRAPRRTRAPCSGGNRVRRRGWQLRNSTTARKTDWIAKGHSMRHCCGGSSSRRRSGPCQ